MSETSKATALPWAQGLADAVVAKRPIAGRDPVTVDIFAPILSAEERAANAALIVERVNGWDALVAERDALREALVLALGFVPPDAMVYSEGTYGDRVYVHDAARAALAAAGKEMA